MDQSDILASFTAARREQYPRVRAIWRGAGALQHEYAVLQLSATEAWRVRDVHVTATGATPVPSFSASRAARVRTFTRCDPDTAAATHPIERRMLDIGSGLEWQDDADLAAQFARAVPWAPPLGTA